MMAVQFALQCTCIDLANPFIQSNISGLQHKQDLFSCILIAEHLSSESSGRLG